MPTRAELERQAEAERRRADEEATRAREEADARAAEDAAGRGSAERSRDRGLDYGDSGGFGRGGVGFRRSVTALENEARTRAENDRRRGYLDADPTMTPRYTYEDAVESGPSAFGDADRESLEAQRRALEMMRVQAETEGFTPAEQAMMQAGVRQAEQSARGARMADMQALEARGMGGSGMSMLSGQMAADSGADRAADVGAQGMMSAQQRALAAMESYGGQAAQMRGQDQQRASGLDAWNQALAERAQGVGARNTERYNQAQDQGYQNRFQREALGQSQYQTDAQAAENERNRAFAERTGREQRSDALIGGVIGGIGGLVRG